jgi:hypothetical protein
MSIDCSWNIVESNRNLNPNLSQLIDGLVGVIVSVLSWSAQNPFGSDKML